jgi:zinc/manganese transport system permease protein
VGTLLVTTWGQVAKVAAAYAVLGVIQGLLARRFIRFSWAQSEAEQEMPHAGWWDFCFYLLFGIAFAISVQIAGVLLVFSYLIVPAVVTKLFSKSVLVRLITGWIVAVGASLAGLWASWTWDLPTGATIVAAFGALMAGAGALRWLVRRAGDPR